MTILPVKKKREKDSNTRPASSASLAGSSSSSDPNRQQAGSSSGSSAPKRAKTLEDPPPPLNRRSSDGIPPNLPSTSSPRPSQLPSTSTSAAAENVPVRPARIQPAQGRCNSDDEYDREEPSDEQFQRETDFCALMTRRGFVIQEMVGDGACMFRAIAQQMYGDQEMHGQIRELCVNYMAANRDHFRAYITEDYDAYLRRKREEHVHGNHIELQAISEIFSRPIEVYQYSDVPMNVLMPREDPLAPPPQEGEQPANAIPANQQNPPLRLSYHRAVHYNAIIAPNEATIGVGLGLPGLVPGAADRDLMNKAMAKSELEHIEETMLQDKIGMTDYQRTQADLEDQIARDSLYTYFQDMEKARGDTGEPSTSAQSTSSAPAVSEVATSSADSGEGTSQQPPRGTGLYEELLAAQSLDWDADTEDVAIAEALLLSRQEYVRNDDPQDDGQGPSSSGGEGPSSSS